MRYQADTFRPFSLSRILLASAMLSVVVSCADSIAPARLPELEPNFATDEVVSDAEKEAFRALASSSSVGMSSPQLSASYSVVAGPMANLSVSAAPRPYTVSRVAFAKEPSPANVVPLVKDDAFFPSFIPVGFDFEFYGEVHNKFSVHSNGFIMFGPLPAGSQAFWIIDNIPAAANPNNIIALAWSDWYPRVNGSIRYETRGAPGSRRLVLEYSGVGEAGGSGALNSQLVLEEGSNVITIHTTSMTIRVGSNRVTQGVENSSGATATFDSITNAINGVTSPRVKGFFGLTNDAVRFVPPAPNKAPVTLVPGNISVNTAPGSCSAAVEVGSASFSDDAPGASLVGGVRSDNEPLDALYPKGITTIAWTSVDAEEVKTTANQLVTVSDAEEPSIAAPADVSADNDPGMGSAVVNVGNAVAEDNCEHAAVAGARSDGALMSAPFPVGLTTITWTASDESGNSASAIQNVLVRDVEAPSISGFDLSLDATSRSGAVVRFVTVSSDNVAVVRVSCTRESGSMFPIGPTTVTCTAMDAAGNHASDSFVVTVHGAAEQLVAMIGFMEDLDLSGGAANPMLNQLLAALRAVEDESAVSCKKIDDFIKMLTERKKSSE
ncbi:MAG: HYR domain-containing protein, partial [Gemmatimonadaceae bacterium]